MFGEGWVTPQTMNKFVVLEFNTETAESTPLLAIHGPYIGDENDQEQVCVQFTQAEDNPRVFLAMSETFVEFATRILNDKI